MNFRNFLIFLIGSFACLYMAYSSTITVTYVHNDNMRYFDKFNDKYLQYQKDPQYEWLKALGRPIAAAEEEYLYNKINHLSDLSRLRFVTLAVYAFCAAILSSVVASLGIPLIPAFCLSIAIFTLPGNQECIFMPYLFIALASLGSLLAYAVWNSGLIFGIRFILALILLETAFFTYVPATFIFLIPATFVIILKDEDWQVSKKVFIRDMLFGILAGAIYLVIMKVFYYKNLELSGHHVTWENTVDYMKTFLPKGVPQTFNLWDIYNSKILGVSLALFVSGILIVNALWQKKTGEWQRILAIVGTFIIFNMVWFMQGGYLPRTFMASQALAVLLLYWSGEWFKKVFKCDKKGPVYWPVLIMLLGLVSANITTSKNVWNCNAELMFIRSRLAQYADSYTKEIHIIRLKDTTKGYNGLPVTYDNFNSGSTYGNEFTQLIRVALNDLNDPPVEMHCIVTASDYGEPVFAGPNTLIIDMNELEQVSRDH